MFSTLFLSALISQAPVTPKVSEVLPGERAKPQEFTARVGELKRFAGGEGSKWEISAGTVGADIVADGKGNVAFTAEKTGKYTLVCYVDGPCLWVVINVGDSPVIPPAPAPVPPAPVPVPVPPVPVPVPPTPIPPPKPLSPLAEKLKLALDKDGGLTPENKVALQSLADLVVAGIEELAKEDTRFSDDLYDALKKVGESLAKGKVANSRAWLNAELKTIFGDSRFFITDDRRKLLGNELAKLQSAFKEVNPK